MRRRLRHLFWPVPVETEVDEELSAHIELQTARYIREGDSPAAAREKALARFGDAARVRTECTDIRQHMETEMRRTEFIEELRQDALFALRGFRRTPLFTAVALATFAIGVGANTTIFSVVDAVLLRPLPYANTDRNVVLFNAYNQTGLEHAAISGAELFDFRETMPSLDAIAGFRPAPATLTAEGFEPEPLSVLVTTPNLFEVIGAGFALGRGFLPGDGAPSSQGVAVLSHALWQRRFGGDSTIIGKEIAINAVPRMVVGVMAEGMRFPDSPVGHAKQPADVYIANTLETTRTPEQRGNQNLVVVGRMRDGATRAAIDRDLDAVSTRFKREYPDRYASAAAHEWRVVTPTLREEMVGAVRPALLMLMAAVALVLLIACVNVANLLLARTTLRQRELAVRLALGANRTRLLRQLLTESTMLALLGGLLGVVVGWVGVRSLRTFGVVEMPQLASAAVDSRVVAFSFAVSAIAGVMIGLIPAMQQSGVDLRGVLVESSRGSAGGSRRRVRTALVVAQVAMALIVLNTAGLLGRSFMVLQRVEPGFAPQGVMSSYVNLPYRQYDSASKVTAFYERLGRELAGIPGVTSVGVVYPLPQGGEGWSGSFDVEGFPADALEGPHAEYAVAMPGYFRTMGIPLRGRDFTADDRAGRPLTVIVDEDLAKKYWPGQDAIGKRISPDAEQGQWLTIVGVVGHVRSAGPSKPSEPQLYLPFLQHPQQMMYPVVKTAAAPASLAPAIRNTVRGLDRNLPVTKQRTVVDLVHDALARQRFNLVMIGLFALTALALASIGLYGVMAYLVAQRTKEIGIRVALGGQPSDVRGLVVKESIGIALVGLVVGTAGSLVLSRGMTGMLYEIRPDDPTTYVTVAALLTIVAALAAFGPARRATRVDPLTALRE